MGRICLTRLKDDLTWSVSYGSGPPDLSCLNERLVELEWHVFCGTYPCLSFFMQERKKKEGCYQKRKEEKRECFDRIFLLLEWQMQRDVDEGGDDDGNQTMTMMMVEHGDVMAMKGVSGDGVASSNEMVQSLVRGDGVILMKMLSTSMTTTCLGLNQVRCLLFLLLFFSFSLGLGLQDGQKLWPRSLDEGA